MESNTELKERLRNLEDVIDSRTFIARHSTAGSTLRSRSEQNLRNRPETNIEMRLTESKHPASSGSLQKSYFDFEPDLKASRVYRRVKRDTMDYSFRSSVASRTWSMFSGLSLSDVSIMSVIALPICSEDLTNPGHYAFGSDHPPPRSMQTQIVFDRERSIFHDCIEVKAQLLHCPGFTALFDETNALQDEATNPMDELRRVFQQGFPLLMLSNFWQGSKDDKDISALQAAGEADKGRLVKLAAHEFLFDLAVLLRMDLRDLFTFDDFVGSSYIGFSKVSYFASIKIR